MDLSFRNSALVFLLLIAGCKPRLSNSIAERPLPLREKRPIYSHHFLIRHYQSFKVMLVYGEDTIQPLHTFAMGNQDSFKRWFPEATWIPEVKRAVCFSTSHIAAFALLGDQKKIVGVTNATRIFDSTTQLLLHSGKILDVGKDYQPDFEKIAALQPDLVFCDGESGNSITAKMRALKLPVVASRDFYEQLPLARAEWLHFFAFFLNREAKADSLLTVIALNYHNNQFQNKDRRPTVFFNVPYNGIWYMPAKGNYITQLVEHAGGAPSFAAEAPNNGFNLTLQFEQVFARCAHADYWLHTSPEHTLLQLTAHDARFNYFDAVKHHHVFSGNKRMTVGNGNDWWEQGVFRPDLLLRDLRLLLHPPVNSDSLFFYQQLQ
ncbi:MAG: ABC transporter substrate-binding protein [Chitinophagales bacterium]